MRGKSLHSFKINLSKFLTLVLIAALFGAYIDHLQVKAYKLHFTQYGYYYEENYNSNVQEKSTTNKYLVFVCIDPVMQFVIYGQIGKIFDAPSYRYFLEAIQKYLMDWDECPVYNYIGRHNSSIIILFQCPGLVKNTINPVTHKDNPQEAYFNPNYHYYDARLYYRFAYDDYYVGDNITIYLFVAVCPWSEFRLSKIIYNVDTWYKEYYNVADVHSAKIWSTMIRVDDDFDFEISQIIMTKPSSSTQNFGKQPYNTNNLSSLKYYF
jgi:hypothetical protein